MASKRDKVRKVSTTGLTWLSKLAEEISVGFPPEGEGWATLKEICTQLGYKPSVVQRILAEKKAEVKKFRALSTDGKNIIINHYRLP